MSFIQLKSLKFSILNFLCKINGKNLIFMISLIMNFVSGLSLKYDGGNTSSALQTVFILDVSLQIFLGCKDLTTLITGFVTFEFLLILL